MRLVKANKSLRGTEVKKERGKVCLALLIRINSLRLQLRRSLLQAGYESFSGGWRLDFSVLTHETIIDAAWETHIQPMLL